MPFGSNERLQPLVDRAQRRRQRREHAGRLVARAKRGRVAADRRGRVAHLRRRQRGREPALRAVPLDQLVAGEAEQRRGLRQRQAPQRRVLVRDRVVGGDEERVGVVAQALPERRRRGRRDRLAAELRALPRRPPRSRRAGARSGLPFHHALASSGSGRAPQPCSSASASAGLQSKRSVASACGARQHLERDLDDRRRGCPSEPAMRRETS